MSSDNGDKIASWGGCFMFLAVLCAGFSALVGKYWFIVVLVFILGFILSKFQKKKN